MDTLLYAGGYSPGSSNGIRLFRFDGASGALSPAGEVPDSPDASFLALHPSGRFLYAVHEAEEGAVSAYAVDGETGALSLLNRLGSGGAHPCHVSVAPAGDKVLVANYSGGSVAAFPVGRDGRLGKAVIRKHQGSGPDRDRQGAPHAHCILPDPSGAWALAADLGADRIFVYALSGEGGEDILRPAEAFALPAGRGPRHLAFHTGGRLVYCVSELEPILSVLDFDPVTRRLRTRKEIDLRVPGAGGRCYPSEVKVHPSGRFLHAALRGAGDGAWDGFAALPLDGAGLPGAAAWFPAGGSFPRHFGYAGGGGHLVAALQKGDGVAVFKVDTGSGALEPAGTKAVIPSPACVLPL